MIKNYVPLRDVKKIHVVELTHLFGENKLVTRHYMQGDSAAEILAIYADEDSSWLSDDFESVEGTLYYSDQNDIVNVVIGDVTVTVRGGQLASHLVAIEVVEVR